MKALDEICAVVPELEPPTITARQLLVHLSSLPMDAPPAFVSKRLEDANKALYDAAASRGSAYALRLAKGIIVDVLLAPPRRPVVGGKRARDAPPPPPAPLCDPRVVSDHRSIRFAIYRKLTTAFGYNGMPQTPYPPCVEGLLKAVLP